MELEFACPQCRSRVPVLPAEAGHVVTCPRCRAAIPLPRHLLHRGYVLNHHAIVGAVGAGRYGAIYQAHHLETNAVVAIRVPDEQVTGGGENLAGFCEQLARFARFTHPHLAPILFFGQFESVPYYATEFLTGESLADRLHAGGRLDETETLRLLQQLTDALDYLHRQGFVPRDLTPTKVMFDDAGNAKWCDLVLARPLVPDEPAGPSPQRYGTPAYASPEQIRGESAGDPRANLYALGVMAFELLTGRTPFARPTDGDMLAAHLTEPVPDPRRLVPVSPATTALIERLLTKNPANRFQSAAELLTALRGVRPGVRQPATQRLDLIKNRPAAPTYSLHKQSPVITPPAQARWPLLTLAGALGLLAALVALTWWTPISEPPQPAIASSAAGIQIVVSNGNYHVTAPSYRARLGADGCLHNLFVGDIDLLDDKIGSSRGAYFTSTTRRAIELPQLRAVGANVRATDGQFTATYAFEADGVVVRLQQNSSERPRFTVTTSAAFTTVRDGPQGVPAQLPTTNEWHEVRFETPTGLWLDLHGGGKLYKPWGTKRQMNWTRSLTTGEDARIALRIGHP